MNPSSQRVNELPLNLHIHKVLEHLKTELCPVSAEEIQTLLGGIDGATLTNVLRELTSNPKVLREPDGRWRIRSKHYLRNKDDLLVFLRRNPTGTVMSDLYESYKGVKEDLREILERDNPRELIKIRNTSTKKDMLYPSEFGRLNCRISPEIRQCFLDVRVPDDVDVHRFLVAKKLKSDGENGTTLGAAVAKSVTRRRAVSDRRRNKRVRLTNTHMSDSGIDLTAQFGGAKSAFN